MSKKATIREVDDYSLEKEIGRLRTIAYPQHPETQDYDFYSSVYRWLAKHPLADQMHRWAAVNEDGEVVGFVSALPQYYRINGRRVIAHTPSDYMAHPDYGFYALSLMRTFFRNCENCVACDMVPATIRVETRLGAEVAGQLHYAMKPISIPKVPAPPMPRWLAQALKLQERTVPVAQGYAEPAGGSRSEESEEPEVVTVRPQLSLPLPVKRLANAGLRLVDEALGRVFGSGVKVENIEEFDASFDELFEKAASSVPCIPEKDAEFLRWRYGPDCPQHPVKVLGVREGGAILGYAVLVIAPTGEDAYILDLMTLPERSDVKRALLRESVRFFRRNGARIIRYRFRHSPISVGTGDLRRLGFFRRDIRLNSLLVKFSDPTQNKIAHHVANWAYSIGDGEPAFWMRQELPDWIELNHHDS